MTLNEANKANIEADLNENHADQRLPRSIRFSDAEWGKVEKAAARRALSPGTFVRNAALADAADQKTTTSNGLTPEILELIKRIYRSTYILSTIKRDEMIHDGRREELDRTIQAAREAEAFLLDDTSK